MMLHTNATIDGIILLLNMFRTNRRNIQAEFSHVYIMILMEMWIEATLIFGSQCLCK